MSERKRLLLYEAGIGRRVKLLPPDAPIPELACKPDEVWDVWEFNAEDESLSKAASRFGLCVGPPISPHEREPPEGADDPPGAAQTEADRHGVRNETLGIFSSEERPRGPKLVASEREKA